MPDGVPIHDIEKPVRTCSGLHIRKNTPIMLTQTIRGKKILYLLHISRGESGQVGLLSLAFAVRLLFEEEGLGSQLL